MGTCEMPSCCFIHGSPTAWVYPHDPSPVVHDRATPQLASQPAFLDAHALCVHAPALVLGLWDVGAEESNGEARSAPTEKCTVATMPSAEMQLPDRPSTASANQHRKPNAKPSWRSFIHSFIHSVCQSVSQSVSQSFIPSFIHFYLIGIYFLIHGRTPSRYGGCRRLRVNRG